MNLKEIKDTPYSVFSNDIDEKTLEQFYSALTLPYVTQGALMPDAHLGYGLPIGGVVATKEVVVPAWIGFDIGCFVGSTSISLVNGTEKTLKELYDEKAKNFYVYSLTESGDYAVGKADKVKLTRKNAKLVKVTLDNSEEIICTPDHKFYLSNLGEVRAEQLTPGTSLKALYRKKDKDGYELIGKKSYHYLRTSWLVAQSGYLGEIPNFTENWKLKTVIHHKDRDKTNNYPENLQFMTFSEHASLHASERDWFKTEEFKQKKRETIQDRGYFFDPKYYRVKKEVAIKNITKYMDENPKQFKEVVKKNAERGSKFFTTKNSDLNMKRSQKLGNIRRIVEKCLIENNIITEELWIKYRRKGDYLYKTAIKNAQECGFDTLEEVINWCPQNHKVISVEKVIYREDVYCITVDKYHNFALSSGIFVRNCGVSAVRTKYTRYEMETDKDAIFNDIYHYIPMGYNSHEAKQDTRCLDWHWGYLSEAAHKIYKQKAEYQLGTLGGGKVIASRSRG